MNGDAVCGRVSANGFDPILLGVQRVGKWKRLARSACELGLPGKIGVPTNCGANEALRKGVTWGRTGAVTRGKCGVRTICWPPNVPL